MKFSKPGKQPQQPRRRTEHPVAEQPQQVSQFRRNQTLTARRPSHPDQVSGRSQIHSLTAHRRKIISIFLLVLGVSILLTIILTQFTARVTIASSSKPITQSITLQSYEEAINEYYAIHPVERLRFLLNEQALTQYVASIHPEIEQIELSSIKDVVEAGLTVRFREPIAGWQINSRQYYVDASGVVFQANYGIQPKVQIVDESGVSPTEGTTVASARLLGFVGRLVSSSAERSYTVTSVTLPVGTTRQLAVRFDGVGGYVLFTIDRGVAQQVEDMARSLKHLKDTGQATEYVDVRIEGRAIYR
jgi:cell division septal protein FtsQ